MHASKYFYFLFLAAFMLAAKPFVGFHALKKLREGKPFAISTKAFTKRKHEYVEDGAFDISTIQKRLANPLLAQTVLFSFLLNTLFPVVLRKLNQITNSFLSAIHLSLYRPLHRELLSGKLII